jgi:hypothetical protein
MMKSILIPTSALLLALLSGCGDVPPAKQQQQSASVTSLPDSIRLRASNGMYVSADLGATGEQLGVLIANRPEPGAWETFAVEDLGEGKMALRAANGRVVCADRAKGGRLQANRDQIGDWETFELLSFNDQNKVLRTMDGFYVCADQSLEGAANATLTADRKEAGEWETFVIEEVGTK